MNAAYPVDYHVDPPLRFTRLQLRIRFVAFCALGNPQATPSSAMWRIVAGFPSALALCVLCWIGTFV